MLSTLQSAKDLRASASRRCPVCVTGTLAVFFEVEAVPVLCNVLCSTLEEALSVPRGDLRLGFCHDCGHIYNTAFEPQLMRYTPAYENSLQFSPRFRAYLESVAQKLVERCDLRGKDIVEIGCGQGDFLSLLCRLGANRGTGFDPSFNSSKASTVLASGVEIVPRYFNAEDAATGADMICCRHVLEHIERPLDFLRQLRQGIGDRSNPWIFFEVPSALFTLHGLAIWDLIYEHCSYFTPQSLRRLFELAGFEVVEIEEVYERQFLTIIARPARCDPPPSTVSDRLQDSVRRFAGEYQSKVRFWEQKRDELQSQHRRAVIWGAGSKGATFLNVLGFPREVLPFAVDLNERKHDHFVAGCGQKVVAPGILSSFQPDFVIVMNPIYGDEIRSALCARGVRAQVLSM